MRKMRPRYWEIIGPWKLAKNLVGITLFGGKITKIPLLPLWLIRWNKP